jgi:hypothetical protein
MFFSNKINPLCVSANYGHHQKATNTSKEMLHMYYMRVTLGLKIVKIGLLKLIQFSSVS